MKTAKGTMISSNTNKSNKYDKSDIYDIHNKINITMTTYNKLNPWSSKKYNSDKNKILDFYNNWDVENLPNYIKSLMKFEEKLVENIISNSEEFDRLKKTDRILDCGCGFGSYYELTRHLNTIYVDFSVNLLKKFENTWGLKSNKICCDILNLPFKDSSFDYILCINVLEHIENYKKALYELNRVLKNGGHIAIIVVNDESFINEEVFNDFEVYHRALTLKHFKNIEGLAIKHYETFYFVPPIFKIFPPFVLDKILNKYIQIDSKFRTLFKRKGQFLYILMEKMDKQ